MAIQTDPVKSSNKGTDIVGNAIGIQTDHTGNIGAIENAVQTDQSQYRSQYARQIAAMDTEENNPIQRRQQLGLIPMDTTENNQQVSLPPIAHRQPLFLPPPTQHQIIQRNPHTVALPPIAHQQSTFMQPPTLIGPQQQLALPPITYQQQLALPQPQQQLALPQPQQQLAFPATLTSFDVKAVLKIGDFISIFFRIPLISE